MKRIGKLLLLIGLMALVTAAVAHAGVQTTAATNSVRTLRYGDRGEEVARLQSMLAQAGFSPGPVDGAFGPKTERAVREAQTHFGLVVDGLAGRLTQGALQEAAAAQGRTQAVAAAAPEPAVVLQPSPSGSAQQLVFYSATTRLQRTDRFASQLPSPGSRITPGPEEIAYWSAPTSDSNPGSDARSAAGATAPTGSAPPDSGAARLQPLRLFALTFDGEPTDDLTPALLGILKRHGMKATFFVSGEAAERSPALLAAIVADGHAVENNGYGSFDMTRLSDKMMSTQLRLASNAIVAATGRTPTYFRPPTGRFNSKLTQAASRQNLKFVLWSNVLASDETGLAPEEQAKRLQESVHPGAILMLHQDRPNSVKAVDQLLAGMRQQGYQSVALDGLMNL